MKFHEKLRAFREEQLNITQQEAAKLLHISNVNLSRYETSGRQPNLELLNKMREQYGMSDQQFLNLVIDKPSERRDTDRLVGEAHETQSRYYSQYAPLIQELLKEEEFRLLLLHLRDLPRGKRRQFLDDALKNRIQET